MQQQPLREILTIIDDLLAAEANSELGLKEMKRRAQHIVIKLEELNGTLQDLASDVQACISADAQKEAATEAPSAI